MREKSTRYFVPSFKRDAIRETCIDPEVDNMEEVKQKLEKINISIKERQNVERGEIIRMLTRRSRHANSRTNKPMLHSLLDSIQLEDLGVSNSLPDVYKDRQLAESFSPKLFKYLHNHTITQNPEEEEVNEFRYRKKDKCQIEKIKTEGITNLGDYRSASSDNNRQKKLYPSLKKCASQYKRKQLTLYPRSCNRKQETNTQKEGGDQNGKCPKIGGLIAKNKQGQKLMLRGSIKQRMPIMCRREQVNLEQFIPKFSKTYLSHLNKKE